MVYLIQIAIFFTLHPRGKLLLTAEYFVLDGATALAIPTRLGQRFTVYPADQKAEHDLYWRAHDHQGKRWFSRAFDRVEWAAALTVDEDPATRIRQLLYAAEQLRPGCTDRIRGIEVNTQLQFDRQWGLGSSSTLVYAVAQWLRVDPYRLLENTFGGSGYDIACAGAEGPILYTRKSSPAVTPQYHWHPTWLAQTHFVYRNQKQNSRAGIRAYRAQKVSARAVDEATHLTHALLNSEGDTRGPAQIFQEHESLVGKSLGLTPIKEELFSDFPGQIKSLGAWGGDFIWAISKEDGAGVRAYFNERGFPTVIPYNELIL